MCRPPFSNWLTHVFTRLLYKLKGLIHLAAKSGKKQEKEDKWKHDSGKLSNGDKIDLMIII